jgi:hypothetical protein
VGVNGHSLDDEEHEVIDPVARARAESAVNHSLAVVESMGRLTREMVEFRGQVSGSIDNLASKVDAAIGDIREARQEVRSMRPKVDSISDADDRLTDLEREIKRRKHAEAVASKMRRRLIMAVLLGIAGTVGAGLGAEALLKMGLPVSAEHSK